MPLSLDLQAPANREQFFIPNPIERTGTSAVVTEVTAQETINPPVYRLTSGYRQSIGHKFFT